MYVIQFSVHEYVHAATGRTTLTVYVVYVCSLFGTRSCPLVSTLINSQINKQAREDKVEELHGLPVKLKHSPPVFKEGNPQRLGLEMGKTMTFQQYTSCFQPCWIPSNLSGSLDLTTDPR